jgi:hypothetical protein
MASHLDIIIGRAERDQHARMLLTDLNHLLSVIEDAARRDGVAAPLHTPEYYEPGHANRPGAKRDRPWP